MINLPHDGDSVGGGTAGVGAGARRNLKRRASDFARVRTMAKFGCPRSRTAMRGFSRFNKL